MNRNTTATRTTTDTAPRRGALRGHASGVLITAFFGLAWLSWGMSDIHGSATLPVTIVGILVALALLAGALHLFRLANRAPAETGERPDRDRMTRRFGWIVCAEYVVLGAVAGILAGLDLNQWIASAVCAGVGLHFLPLAALFEVPMYYVTGGAMFVLAVVTMIAVPAGAPTVLWEALPGLGSAIVLWVTSVLLIRNGTRSTAATSVS
jgi:hypothetical protein